MLKDGATEGIEEGGSAPDAQDVAVLGVKAHPPGVSPVLKPLVT